MKEFIEFAPIIIVVVAFLIRHKLFVTPEQLQLDRKALMKEVEERFLSLVAFKQFEKRIEDNFLAVKENFATNSKRFDHIDESLDHIKDILINRNH